MTLWEVENTSANTCTTHARDFITYVSHCAEQNDTLYFSSRMFVFGGHASFQSFIFAHF